MNIHKQDFFLSCKECILESPRNFYGCFSLGPFKNNQTLSVANALRRTLLTEISGIAITHVEIDGIFHEYSTLDGVRESILDILLNIKQVVLKTSVCLTKPVYGYLNVRGPGIVRISDFKFPPNIQSIDPDQYIATLNDDGWLCLKFTISDSRTDFKTREFQKTLGNVQTLNNSENESFQSFLQKKNTFFSNQSKTSTNLFSISEKQEDGLKKRVGISKGISSENEKVTVAKRWLHLQNSDQKDGKNQKFKNLLWVDPFFNSVSKVNYLIETIEPIQQNLPNQILQIELWTNGSIHPRQALYNALNFLKKMFDKLDELQFLNSQYQNFFFDSETKNTKIFKNFEYDLQFYTFLKAKEKKRVSLFEKIQKNSHKKLNLEIEKKNQHSLKTLKKETQKQSNFSERQKKNLLVEQFNFPSRILKCLLKNNFFTIQDLLNVTPNELKKFCGFGNFSIYLIQKKLKKSGFHLKSVKKK